MLLVESDDSACAEFLEFAEPHGFLVHVARTPLDAIRMVQRTYYPLAVGDQGLCTDDGLLLSEQLVTISPDTAFVTYAPIPAIQPLTTGATSAVRTLRKPWCDTEQLSALHTALETTTTGTALEALDILLLEDNPSDSELFVTQLETFSNFLANVTAANSLKSALNLVSEQQPDVIIADLSLPDSSGLDSVRQLAFASPRSAIIVLTNMQDQVLALKAVRLGAQDYVVKKDLKGAQLPKLLRINLERKRTSLRLAQLAHCDALTGLANRTRFHERLDDTLATSRRHNRSFVLGVVDVDQFKHLNDTYGHGAGDQVLQEISQRLPSALRTTDMVARLGGDEFAMLLEEANDKEGLQTIIQRVCKIMDAPFLLGDDLVQVTLSIGFACFPEVGDTIRSLFKSADDAMYQAKRKPGTSAEIATPQVTPETGTPRLQRLRELRHAVEDNRFVLHYQPQYELRTGNAFGTEALIRWNRSENELAGPNTFIPLLEQTGGIVAVGQWVLEQACEQTARWNGKGHRLHVSVNVSPEQLSSPGFARMVEQTLQSSGLPPEFLELEITETVLMSDTKLVRDTLEEVHQMGVRLAVDDFGTGYAALTYLNLFPVDVLKIDRSFVMQARSGQRGASVTAAIVALGHSLELEVVAEGIEQESQRQLLLNCNCDRGQGYLLGKPQHPDDFEVVSNAPRTSMIVLKKGISQEGSRLASND